MNGLEIVVAMCVVVLVMLVVLVNMLGQQVQVITETVLLQGKLLNSQQSVMVELCDRNGMLPPEPTDE